MLLGLPLRLAPLATDAESSLQSIADPMAVRAALELSDPKGGLRGPLGTRRGHQRAKFMGELAIHPHAKGELACGLASVTLVDRVEPGRMGADLFPLPSECVLRAERLGEIRAESTESLVGRKPNTRIKLLGTRALKAPGLTAAIHILRDLPAHAPGQPTNAIDESLGH